MTDDQKARRAEFIKLFDTLPGPRMADRVRQVVERTGCKPATVRQWMMAEPYRIPSWQMLRLLRADPA